MKNFKELRIWQKGFQIAVSCYNLTAVFPKEEKYSICSQINRCSLSIASNIAEGSVGKVKRTMRGLLKSPSVPVLNWKPNCWLPEMWALVGRI